MMRLWMQIIPSKIKNKATEAEIYENRSDENEVFLSNFKDHIYEKNALVLSENLPMISFFKSL